jgi:pimeloyl-ACP methyl ester carboxylesterase
MLPQIDVPTLVVCGQHDSITTADEMRSVSNSIPSAQFLEIADAGHMSPLENPPSVNDAIRRFLCGLA